MRHIPRFLVVLAAAFALATVDGSVFAQGKGKDRQEQDAKGKDAKPEKKKEHKHKDGKKLVADKLKKDGEHKLEDHGKHSAFVKVKQGKVAGMRVKHAEKGDVPVKKYKTKKKMVEAPSGGMQPVSFVPVQAEYLGTTWIGYAYIDDWGDEVIYWYPYDMVYDHDTGATEYIPVY